MDDAEPDESLLFLAPLTQHFMENGHGFQDAQRLAFYECERTGSDASIPVR